MKKTIAILMFAGLISLCVAKREREAPELFAAPPSPTIPKADEKPVFLENYEDAVATQGKKVLVIFGADWCGYCNLLKRDLKDMSLDGYVVCIVNIDDRPDLNKSNRVSLLPTSVVIKDGKEIGRKQGYNKDQYKNWLESMEAK